MDEATKLSREVERGERANRILSDPMVQGAFVIVEQHILEQFKNAPVDDTKALENAKHLLHVFGLFKGLFEDAVVRGKVASQAMNPAKRGAQFLGDIWRKKLK